MQLVAEIASYEDFVDEGNYNVAATLDEVVLHSRKRPGFLLTVKAQRC